MSMGRLFLVFAGLFCVITAGMFLMERGNADVDPHGVLAQSFYYSAIAFAVYHMYTRNKKQT